MTREELLAALGAVTVVDARPPGEFGARHLPGAVNLLDDDPNDRIEGTLRDRAAPVVVHGDERVAERLRTLGYEDVRTYDGGLDGLPAARPVFTSLRLEDVAFSPTAALFEGHPRAGVDISVFVTRTPPGAAVELHVHPYAETFLLLEGTGRWTAGENVVELAPEGMLVVPPDTPHGFRNTGDVPLLVVSVHERGTLRQTWLGRDPA